MSTVITNDTSLKAINDIIDRFNEKESVDILSSRISPIEKAIVVDGLRIQELTIDIEASVLSIKLNNDTLLQRSIIDLPELNRADKQDLANFENLGDGIIWPNIPHGDISLKKLLEEELYLKYKLHIS